MAERAAVNRYVGGSNPSLGAMETYLKKAVGHAGVGTPVEVVSRLRDCYDLYRCILNGRTRILIRDEFAMSPDDEKRFSDVEV